MLEAFVINLNHRQDRWKIFQENWGKSNLLHMNKFVAQEKNTIYNTAEKACFISHLNIIRMAKQAKLPFVIILEDDARPGQIGEKINIKEWDSKFKKVYEYLLENSDKWEVYHAAGCFNNFVKSFNVDLDLYTVRTLHLHFYVVNSSAYDKILAFDVMSDIPIDLFFQYYLNQVASYPALSEQYSGFSDIREADNLQTHLTASAYCKYFDNLFNINFKIRFRRETDLEFLKNNIPDGSVLCLSHNIYNKKGPFFVDNLGCLLSSERETYINDTIIHRTDVNQKPKIVISDNPMTQNDINNIKNISKRLEKYINLFTSEIDSCKKNLKTYKNDENILPTYIDFFQDDIEKYALKLEELEKEALLWENEVRHCRDNNIYYIMFCRNDLEYKYAFKEKCIHKPNEIWTLSNDSKRKIKQYDQSLNVKILPEDLYIYLNKSF